AADPATARRILSRLGNAARAVPVGGVAVSSDLRWLLTRGDGGIRLLDLQGKGRDKVEKGEDWLPGSSPLSPDHRWLLTHRVGLPILTDLRLDLRHPLPVRQLQAAAFSPDGRWLATSAAEGPIELWDLSA